MTLENIPRSYLRLHESDNGAMTADRGIDFSSSFLIFAILRLMVMAFNKISIRYVLHE
jgi:hypothetical protein